VNFRFKQIFTLAPFFQGGAGARVTGVPLQEQRIQGGVMSRFYQNSQVKDGDSFRVIVDDAHE
jgi:hypothetical protein